MRPLAMILSLGFLVAGCAQTREDAIIGMGQQVFLKVVDKAKIDSSNMAANGKLVNPAYEYEWFGGVGPYSKGRIQVIGAEVGASVNAAGVGEGSADQDLREKLYMISQRKDIESDARKDLILQAIFEWALQKNIKVPTSQPTGGQ